MAYISKERREKLKQEVKELFDRMEREEREKKEAAERRAEISSILRSHKTTKTYKDYLAEKKPIVNNLAAVGALPKTSKGDYPKARFTAKQDAMSGYLRVSYARINKRGNIAIK